MRVATWNIHRGRGTLAPFRPDRILAVLAELDAGIIALQEAQHHFDRARPMLDADALARLGLRPATALPGQQGWRSNLLLLRDGVRLLRTVEGLPLGGWEPRGALLAEVEFGAGPFRVLVAHLSLSAAQRRRQAQLLQAAAARAPAMPALLLGDLNEWRPARLDALWPFFARPIPAPSFPAWRPTLSLDRVLGHPAGLVEHVWAHDTPAARAASDHLPVVGQL